MPPSRARRRGARWLNVVGWVMFALAVALAVFVRLRVPWIPVTYLTLLIGCAVVGWRLLRSRASGRPKWVASAMVLLALFCLLPVPWMQADLANPPGTAWRLDGWINVDGSVGTISDLLAKAQAARDVGADLLLFPAAQTGALAEFDSGSMALVPVGSLDEAIQVLGE